MKNIEILRGVLRAIQNETTPIQGHSDPGAITDCWNEVWDQMNKLEVELSGAADEFNPTSIADPYDIGFSQPY